MQLLLGFGGLFWFQMAFIMLLGAASMFLGFFVRGSRHIGVEVFFVVAVYAFDELFAIFVLFAKGRTFSFIFLQVSDIVFLHLLFKINR